MSTELPDDALLAYADEHLKRELGHTLAELLEPIDPAQPAGGCMKDSGVHRAVIEARREDDASLPQGEWQHALKRADWQAVGRTVADNLRRKTKDLQLAAWLLEAQIHRCGLAGIAPGVVLIDALLACFGRDLHPQEPPGRTLHRANILRWINRKLLPAVKQVPLTACGRGTEYTWADREAAARREQTQAGAGAGTQEPLACMKDVQEAMSLTPAAHHEAQGLALDRALEALARLGATVNGYFDDGDRPSLGGLAGLLRLIQAAVHTELHRRSLLRPVELPPVQAPVQAGTDAGGPRRGPVAKSRPGSVLTRPLAEPQAQIPGRAEAYALLETVVRTLMVTDPHSPAPYLVQRAIEWGRLSTAELYRKVFIEMGGQLSIFELLGLEPIKTNEN